MAIEIKHLSGPAKGTRLSLDQKIAAQERRYRQATALWERRAANNEPLTNAAFRAALHEGTSLLHLLQKQVAAVRAKEKAIREETQRNAITLPQLKAEISQLQNETAQMKADIVRVNAETARVKKIDPNSAEAQEMRTRALNASKEESNVQQGKARRLLSSLGFFQEEN